MRALAVTTAWALALGLAAPASDAGMEFFSSSSTLDRSSAVPAQVMSGGFVFRYHDYRVIGDALRFQFADPRQGTPHLGWAEGRIVLNQGDLRIAADRMGLKVNGKDLEGDAWDVQVTLPVSPRPGHSASAAALLRVSAKHVQFSAQELVFSEVTADLGHGSAAQISAARLRVFLRQGRDHERSGAGRFAEGIAVIRPSVSLGSVPILWFPYLYRDFLYEYPWTRIEAGHSARPGSYARYWIGSNLPTIAGMHSWLAARGDLNSRDGEGYGALARWRHDDLGRGSVSWLRYPRAAIPDPANQRRDIATRRSEVVDAAHRVDVRLGDEGWMGWSARWLSVPQREYTEPGVLESQPGLRFRTDHLPLDVNREPVARRMLSGALSVPLLTATMETRRRIHADDPATERWSDLRLGLVPLAMVGPLHVSGDGEVEELRRRSDNTTALRARWNLGVIGGDWFGDSGVGYDVSLGGTGLGYDQIQIAGVEQTQAFRSAPLATATMRMRLLGTWGEWTHALTPRFGAQVIGEGHGQTLPTMRFDAGDTWVEDRRYWLTGLGSSLQQSGFGTRLTTDIALRWAMRDVDRIGSDHRGNAVRGDMALADITFSADGRPLADLRLSVDGVFDQRPREWKRFDAAAAWQAFERIGVRWDAVLLPTTTTAVEWQHRPAVIVTGDRYRTTLGVDLLPGGPTCDRFHTEITRLMIEGDLSMRYDWVRGLNGARDDHRISVGFSVGGDGSIAGPYER